MEASVGNFLLFNGRSCEFEKLLRMRYLHLQAPSSSSRPPVKCQYRTDVLPNQGPNKIEGDILEDPDLLWAELDFNEERLAEAQLKLREQVSSMTSSSAMSSYWKERYMSQAGMYWHEFYKRNSNKFYKDRHYLHMVFPELLDKSTEAPQHSTCLKLCEVGAGVCKFCFSSELSFPTCSSLHHITTICNDRSALME